MVFSFCSKTFFIKQMSTFYMNIEYIQYAVVLALVVGTFFRSAVEEGCPRFLFLGAGCSSESLFTWLSTSIIDSLEREVPAAFDVDFSSSSLESWSGRGSSPWFGHFFSGIPKKAMTYLTCKFLFDHEDMSYYFENITKVVNEIHARALNNIHFKDS